VYPFSARYSQRNSRTASLIFYQKDGFLPETLALAHGLSVDPFPTRNSSEHSKGMRIESCRLKLATWFFGPTRMFGPHQTNERNILGEDFLDAIV